MLDNLLVLSNMKDQIKIISDMAFDHIDEDCSGGLDVDEISVIMHDVAIKMGVTPPTQEDLQAILAQLDENSNGQVDKGEFLGLIMLVIGKMLESE